MWSPVILYRIRVMFSIADIQTGEESDFSREVEEDSPAHEDIHAYPLRVSLSITKVRLSVYVYFASLTKLSSLFT